MNKIKMLMKLNIKDYIIIVLKEKNIQNLKASFCHSIHLNDTKKQLNVISFFIFQ